MKKEVRVKKGNIRLTILLIMMFFVVFLAKSQSLIDKEINRTPNFFYNHENSRKVIEREHAIERSLSGDSHQLMNLRKSVGAISALVEATEDDYWIGEQKQIIDNLMSTARVSAKIPGNTLYRDNFKGWVSLNKETRYNREVPLYEGYTFFHVAEFLYLLDKIGWVGRSQQNLLWWQNALEFVETNIWTKWYVRSADAKGNNYWYFLRSRTHMGSHWAGIAMYLGAITNNREIKAQTSILVKQYDTLLKRNFIEVEGGYIWNSSYDDVSGTYATAASSDVIQDVSHGNHVLAYIVAAHKFGNPEWQIAEIQKLIYTVKNFMYDKSTKRFSDNVDGSEGSSRRGWGNFVGDGWVRLAAYDSELKTIFENFEGTDMLRHYNQEFIYKANLYPLKLNDAQN